MMLNVLECKKKSKREAFLCISCCDICTVHFKHSLSNDRTDFPHERDK